jgi:uncharacterized damage-inducible protein DinB
MKPEQARVVAEYVCRTIENEMPKTIAVFNSLPSERFDYKPDPKSKSALELMRHIAIEDVWFLDAVSAGTFAAGTDESKSGIDSSADAAAFYQERMPAAIAKIRAMKDEDLLKSIDFMGMWQQPALNFLALSMNHSIHHRGQLSAYIRAMGGKVPAIYGPSADTQMQTA